MLLPILEPSESYFSLNATGTKQFERKSRRKELAPKGLAKERNDYGANSPNCNCNLNPPVRPKLLKFTHEVAIPYSVA
jgi:hypothetical protein